MRERAHPAVGTTDERDRLVGAQKRRQSEAVELLELLAPWELLDRRVAQPRDSKEPNDATLQRLDELIVKARQQLDGRCG